MEIVRQALEVVPGWVVLGVVGAVIAAESGVLVGLVLPGTTGVLALGVLGRLGVAPPLPLGLVVAWLAALVGTQLAYRSGRGPCGLRESAVGQRLGAERWDVADRLVERHGLVAVAVGQSVVVARTLVPRLVAQVGVPWLRFSLVSVPFGARVSGLLTSLGFVAGANVDAVAEALPRVRMSLAVVAAALVALSAAGRLLALSLIHI